MDDGMDLILRYWRDGAFAMSRDEWHRLRCLKDTMGRYAWMPYRGPWVEVALEECPAFIRDRGEKTQADVQNVKEKQT